jgi:uncharacterized protein YqjF (DUF2071 family)
VLSSFHELNCRTYVRRGDRPGIWFFSLDASSRLAVEAARRLYGLPYSYARIRGGDGHFELERSGRGATLTASYHAVGEPAPARLGTLEHFLVERYCLYGRGGDLRAEIHHAPWPLQQAEGEVEQRGVSPVALTGEPLFHFAGRQDVIVWPPERVED